MLHGCGLVYYIGPGPQGGRSRLFNHTFSRRKPSGDRYLYLLIFFEWRSWAASTFADVAYGSPHRRLPSGFAAHLYARILVLWPAAASLARITKCPFCMVLWIPMPCL